MLTSYQLQYFFCKSKQIVPKAHRESMSSEVMQELLAKHGHRAGENTGGKRQSLAEVFVAQFHQYDTCRCWSPLELLCKALIAQIAVIAELAREQ